MKLTILITGSVLALAMVGAPLAAQARVQVSVGVVAPPVFGRVVLGGPRYRVLPPPRVIFGTPRYHRHYWRSRIVVVVPRGHAQRRFHRPHRWHY